MLTRPDLSDDDIVASVERAYGLQVQILVFLPLGLDPNAAVFRVVANEPGSNDQRSFFAKLRSGVFDGAAVALCNLLSAQGVREIIPPVATSAGQLFTRVRDFALVLYPFVEGRDALTAAMSATHWRTFGGALKQIHTVALRAALPAALLQRIPRESYVPYGRVMVTKLLQRAQSHTFTDPSAVHAAALFNEQRDAIARVVHRAEQLAARLQTRTENFVLCHGDAHAGNLLIDNIGGLFIVDWDSPILALKEHDLMFAGGAQGFVGHTAMQEEALFYAGYGLTTIDDAALAYYRYERVVQDIAVYGEQLLLSDAGGADRAEAVRCLAANFLPGGTIAMASRADTSQSL